MISKAFLIFIAIIGIAFHSLTVSLGIGDLKTTLELWKFGFVLFGLFSSYLIAKHIVRKVFSAFQWYRDYIESFNPSRAIMVCMNYKLNLGKDITLDSKDESGEKGIYLELIKFLTGQPLSRRILDSHMYGPGVSLMQEAEMFMKNKMYQNAISPLRSLSNEYGFIPWIYHNLRKCYLETRSFKELDDMNNKTTDLVLGTIKRCEGKIMMLKDDLESIKDVDKKLLIIERIYKLNPSDTDNLIMYLKHLQKVGHFAAGINIIKNSCDSRHDFIKLACEFFETQDPEFTFKTASNMRNSALKYVLIFKSALSLRDVDAAENAVLKLNAFDPILARILELKACQELSDTSKLRTLVDSFSESYTYDMSKFDG